MVHIYPTSSVTDLQTALPQQPETAPEPAETAPRPPEPSPASRDVTRGDATRVMRSDASRNHEAILSAAIAVLASSPQASMHEIAEASGIGRTTLYRHFPDRGSLIEAIIVRIVREANEITRATFERPGDADPIERLAQLACEFASFGNRYEFLLPSPQIAELKYACEPQSELDRQYGVDYIRAAQAAGTIRDDLDAQWLLDVFGSIILQYVHSTSALIRDDPQSQLDLTALRATITSLFAPQRAA